MRKARPQHFGASPSMGSEPKRPELPAKPTEPALHPSFST